MRLTLVVTLTAALTACDDKRTPFSRTLRGPESATSADLMGVELSRGPCPRDMVFIDGTFCSFVGHRCAEWIDEKRDRCRRYVPPPICEGRKIPRKFCIDRYEYPNLRGVLPVVMVTYEQSLQACRAEGKRLCTESEWTQACEGPEMLPYPYGWTRDAKACNIDRKHTLPDFEALESPWQTSQEILRLDQRVRSGEMSDCRSAYGVYDMTGNVDEWTRNELPNRDAGVDISSLKGGYFGPIRGRCRPVTRSHNRWFKFYQAGFRCCADAQLRRPSD